jgi:hypothetical protein
MSSAYNPDDPNSREIDAILREARRLRMRALKVLRDTAELRARLENSRRQMSEILQQKAASSNQARSQRRTPGWQQQHP